MSEAAPKQAPTETPTNETPNAATAPQVPAGEGAQPNAAQTATIEQAAQDGTLSVEELSRLLAGKKIPMKVNGKDRLVDAAQYHKLAQIGHAGFQKATTLEKGFRDFREAFKHDPIDALDRWAAKDPEIAAALDARAERESKLARAQSPEDRKRIEQEYALADREKRIQDQERAQEEARKRAEQERQEEQAKRAAQQWSRVYGQAMTEAGIDPDDQREAYDMILRRHQALLDQGYALKPQHIAKLAQQVAAHLDGLAARRAKKWDAGALEEKLGKDKLREYRKTVAEQVRSPRDGGGRFATTTPGETEQPQRKKVRYGSSMASWRAAMEDARKGK
jgi:hypothetical protein